MEMLFKNGSFLGSPNFSFRFLLDKYNKTPQISFICPKTVSKSAVTRNLLRRRGYVSIRSLKQEIPQNIIGAFIFNKKSLNLYGNSKNKGKSVLFDLKNDILSILNKI